MRKGISTWLFSKLVMFSFLVMVFGIMTQMIILINEKNYNDSAELLSFQIKEAAEGVVNSNTVVINRIIPLPKAIPENSLNSMPYYLEIKENNTLNTIYFGITRGKKSKNILSASSLIYKTSGVTTNLGTGRFIIDSQNYSYLLIKKEKQEVNFSSCKSFEFVPGGNTKRFYHCMDAEGNYHPMLKA